ncbi:MAG: isoprenylcysteine carboxylmethyltransferase family protein [Clostridia bacterium]|nr:isoprenylcysteine carboxylmethyltransferase family protein [Clostridia bacterium]
MTVKLFFQAIIKYFAGVALVGALIFGSAGTFDYFGGQLLMAVLFIPMFAAGIVMMLKDPELLKKRLNAKEKLNEQNTVIKLSALMFISGFAAAGFSYRFGLYMFSRNISLAATAMFLFSYLLYAEVMRENSYLSRTIEVQEGQKVIDTGLYGIVRHPMYSATLILFCSMPVILGSPISFIIFLTYPLIITKRLISEEAFLEKELTGYREYKQKVKYRLIPFIW